METSDATLFCGRDVELKTQDAGISSERIWPTAPGNRWAFEDIEIAAFEACHHSISKFEGQWLSGVPLCFMIFFDSGEKIFFSGDNALGPHYRFYGEVYQPDLALLGIGGINYRGQILSVMNPVEAAIAAKFQFNSTRSRLTVDSDKISWQIVRKAYRPYQVRFLQT